MELRGSKLKEARLRRLWSQQDLAGRAQLTESTVNRLENGLQHARVSTVRKLVNALGITASDILLTPRYFSGEAEGRSEQDALDYLNFLLKEEYPTLHEEGWAVAAYRYYEDRLAPHQIQVRNDQDDADGTIFSAAGSVLEEALKAAIVMVRG